MSDAAFRRSSPGSVLADPDVAQHYVPRAASLLGGDRMEGVNGEREAASSQIQRSLKAWRKAKDDDAKPAYIPESGGKPLGADIRRRMEPKLGADLSDVKMFEGGESTQAAGKLGARAFTVGSDVHFNAGEFAPGTKEGDRLLAHELTHVVQGQKSGVQRKPEGGEEKGGEKGGAEVSDPAEPAEKEADAKGDAVADDLHGGGEKEEKGGGKDDKKKDGKDKKKDDGKHAKDAANDEDGEKKKGGAEAGGGDKKEGGDVKEAAPATAGKLYTKIFLKKPDKPSERTEDQAKELEARIKAHGSAAKTKIDMLKNAVSVGAPVIGALVGFLAGGHEGMMAGFSLGSVGSALTSFFGFSKAKEKVIEETAGAIADVQAVKFKPQVLDTIVNDLRDGKTNIDDVSEQLEKLKEALPRIEKRAADRKAKKAKEKEGKKGPGKAEKVEETAEKGAKGAEGAEVAVEVLEKFIELGHAAAGIAPVLKAASVGMDLVALGAEITEEKADAKKLAEIEKSNKEKGH